jgi:formylglycine-generating enzyme required for sulfatase activity
MTRQRGAILQALTRWCGAGAKRHRRAAGVIFITWATMMGLLLALAPSAAMSRQVGVKAPPPANKTVTAAGEPTKLRAKLRVTKPPARKPTAPKAQTSSDEQRTKSLAELSNSFVKIAAGEFMMGSENGDVDEKPVHRVRISQGFEMGKYEVTQAQWEAVMGSNPSEFKGANLPVENVSWDDAQEFIKRLNGHNDGYVYRLPTEAEWEYACRAGSTGNYAGKLGAMAWYDLNSSNVTHPVGQKQPNGFGLYDLHGNVWEWCMDWYVVNYYSQSPRVDPTGPSKSLSRVRRGGGWNNIAPGCRSAIRNSSTPDTRNNFLGFRLVRILR